MTKPQIAVGPSLSAFALEALERGGCEPVQLGERAEGLIWLDAEDVAGLQSALAATPEIRWVQLPFAGIENFVSSNVMTKERIWTCAKGSYAEPVAEHALALALSGLRNFPERIRANSWGEQAGISLFDQRVTILGGGGIAQQLISLLTPFRTQITVVRRQLAPVTGAVRVLGTDEHTKALKGALVVFVALSLTPETTGIISSVELAAMEENAWLVNVARGRHVVTSDLVDALSQGAIGGAALDVTDPEPLPEGHPLWDLPNCIITPHTADTPEMIGPLLARRITANAVHFLAGEQLEGVIDLNAGY